MKKVKLNRILSFVLSALMVCAMFPLSAGAKTVSKKGEIAPVNKEYVEYLKNPEKYKNGRIPSPLDLSYLNKTYSSTSSKLQKSGILPAKYDSRDKGLSTDVPDQGNYGTCWAFSALGTVESNLISQFPQVSLSEKHLTYFTYKGNEEEEAVPEAAEDPYNMGGNAYQALATMAAWKGPVSSSVLPYDPSTATDENLRNRADYHIQDSQIIDGGMADDDDYNAYITSRTTLVKQAIMANGSLGIDYYSDDSYFNDATNAFYCYTGTYADHAVLVVGWDDNYSKDNFLKGARPEKNGAWLVRNSWGTNWGDDGYFWMSYEDQSLEFDYEYGVEDNDNYKNIYQYDTLGWSGSVSADTFLYEEKASKTGYMSNIFTSNGNESLEAVGFYTTDGNASYDISVYTGVEAGKPTSGTLALSSQSGKEIYAGYHTIELNSPIQLQKGEKYSVVVKLTNPKNAYPIPAEFCFLPLSQPSAKYMGNGGESYVSEDKNDWYDVTEMSRGLDIDYHYYPTNVCLKAYSNPISADKAEVSKVQFSLLEGPVKAGEMLTLSGNGDIYYSVTKGGVTSETIKYTSPIELTGDCSVSAWAQSGDKKGVVTTKEYTLADSLLSSLIVEQNGKINHLDLSDGDKEFDLDDLGGEITIKPIGTDNITVNGTAVKSNAKSGKITLEKGKYNNIAVTSSADGKTSTTYTIKIFGKVLEYDYDNETISFDDTKFSVKDSEGNAVLNGANITKYVSLPDNVQELTVTGIGENVALGEHNEKVPERYVFPHDSLNFQNETTAYAYTSTCRYAYNPQMEDEQACAGTQLTIEPGKNIYVRKVATAGKFASEVSVITVPATRPAAPKAEILSKTVDSVTVKPVENAEYRLLWAGEPISDWSEENTFEEIADVFDDELEIQVRIKATGESFASEISSVKFVVKASCEVDVSYRYNGAEIDRDFVMLPEGKSVVSPNPKVLTANGASIKDPLKNSVTVNVKNEDGELVADKETIVFEVTYDFDFSKYSFNLSYWDIEGTRIPGGGKQAFTSGTVLYQDLPVPEGYQLSTSEEFSGPESIATSIYCWDSSVRYVDPIDVLAVIEKMATLKIHFVSEDGTDLSSFDYQTYLKSEGTNKLKINYPAGYKAADKTAPSVKVLRAKNGDLYLSNDSITVKAVKSSATVNPITPVKPNPKPAQGKLPVSTNTGDSLEVVYFGIAFLLSSAALVTVSVKRKKKEQ